MSAGVIHHPRSTAEAVALLAEDPRSRVLAGGASLVAMLNAGLIEAPVLVSLKESGERGFCALPDGTMRIGAMTRHCETAQSEQLSGMRRCLALAAASIGNMPVRNMGTIGGSVSLADPGADYPAALVALCAAIEVCNPAGTRTIPAAEFFTDWYTTALAPGDLVTAILLPPAHAGVGAYRKLARVAGDFAIVSIALCVDRGGTVSVAVGGAGPRPIFDAGLNAQLSAGLDRDEGVAAVGRALADLADPVDDVRASADYRRMVIPRLLLQLVREIRPALRTVQ